LGDAILKSQAKALQTFFSRFYTEQVLVMTYEASVTERRKYKRFQVAKRALVVTRPYYTRMGRIMDVSMGGLSFSYLESRQTSQESFQLDVLSEDFSALVRELPFEIVSERHDETGPFSSGSTPVKRCRVRFKGLTGQQKSGLQSFIEKHAFAEA
jgi:hypothetical protein